MKRTTLLLALLASLYLPTSAMAADIAAPVQPPGADNFYRSPTVKGERVTFQNQYQMEVVGTLYRPQGVPGGSRAPAVVVGHPMGAVKEQSSQLYAQKLAEQGFVTLAIDLFFWGESAGAPRHLVAPEIYSDDISAAVDFLSTQPFVDPNRIGGLGICGSGSFVVSAAKIDPRIKAIATVSMYDMGAAARQGLNNGQSLDQRKTVIQFATDQRLAEFKGGAPVFVPGTVNNLDADTPPNQREFFDFYRTPRGAYTPEGDKAELTTQPLFSSLVKFMNFYPFNDIETISPRPMLFISGEAAHSREFSEDAYRRAGQPKELYWVKDAGHVDLYDRTHLIPFDKLTSFFQRGLAAK
ncbi:alpha/beta hydrolase [Stenotrophomonas sp. ATCM1_4]|uniref:alpha/beta hydrolase n=1 Tax=Stenotrophomonas sp. ATCM1_4 TaxID=2259330 RepID=UPI00104D62F2|nr:alpha/beta hydrolase [Stenotrophomonas sp. ATCM1_4]TDB29533.1 alpha/beta hydrolase [Stenotrophomonas sp. ATCM1_4]